MQKYGMKIQQKTITNQELNDMEEEIIFYDPMVWLLLFALLFVIMIVLLKVGKETKNVILVVGEQY